MSSHQPWYHGNITRSKAEDLLSKNAKDGSFLLRDSESIQGAYALCVLYQNCVYTYRILPNEEKKLSVQASEGVPIRFFSMLPELVEAYYKENMGLVTHLQYPVQKEEEPDDESDQFISPPQLPPRNITPSECRDCHAEPVKTTEQSRVSVIDTYHQRLQLVDMSQISEEHQKAIQEYFSSAVGLDVEQVHSGNPTLPNLKKLLKTICKGLTSEISRTLPTLESLQRIVDQPMSPGAGRLRGQLSLDASQSVGFRLEQLTKLLYSIEDKAKNTVFESAGYDGGHRKSLIPPVTFEVKSDSLGISNKMFLKVDVESGKVYFKKSKDGPEDKYFVHNKILQLVKSKKMHTKLEILLETEKEKTQRKEFVFNDTKKREGFCQLLQQMKNKHSDKAEPDMISLFVGTWNMGNASPPPHITSWFQSKGQGKSRDDTASQIPHDIYVIGTQEDPLGEKDWIDIVRGTLRDITNISFKQIATQTLWNIRIVVLAKPEHENRISHVFCDSVKTGIANALGNKGAVGVSFMFNDTSFGFVNSHLTSGSEKKIRRNQNYVSILRFLNLGDKKLNLFDITHRFTHLFWLGDLNYRIDLPPTEAENIVMKIKQQQYQELLSRDQLNMERADEKVFLYYEEEEITFPPTYRLEKDTHERYAYTKAKATGTKYNLPSWCDRVLRKSYPHVHVACHSYGCTNDIMTSDHCPVFATFDVGVTSQFVSKNDPTKESQGAIKFMNCVATLKTKSKTKFFIEYHSSCLEKFVKSSEIDNQESTEGTIKVRFAAHVQLTPIISDPEYLLDQHILISITSTDSDESYGETCVALRAAERDYTEFVVPLTHHGEQTGMLSGGIQLRTSEGKLTEKLYDFIKIGDDSGTGKAKPGDYSNNNPNYMDVGYKTNNQPGWSYTVQSSRPGAKDTATGNTSPKKTAYDYSACSPTGKISSPTSEDGQPAEMFDNPLYGSMGVSRSGKDQEMSRKDHLVIPEIFAFPKGSESDADRAPPVPTPRARSFTCSESKGQNPSSTPSSNTNSCSSNHSSNSSLQPQSFSKKPVVPSRSEGGGMMSGKPKLPTKSRPGQIPEPQSKPRDYRDSSELPGKMRPHSRPSQPLPKDVHPETAPSPKAGRPLK
ncbi:phosphatidylinositol 3,4,5-trisphosphate 5-phosphatase 1 isoform X2 [Tachysurus vachellii]|uniref:phosphatidylinositol 3,4,5-trisphosphate 5-phosphatase 1 isoform X2 n=1 Tax=Tachysurus vachellii TaxID=175792 RepID=UPI00296ABF10|nr:phosphatidylinositol 3,4,5-trisphosphate 5-phosphatase 1 isoform X2 [Tachysurus vachellii]